MLKKFGQLVGILVIAGAALSTGAHADESGWNDGDLTTISGEATFARRRTVNTQVCDENQGRAAVESCTRSQTYWALTIQARGMRYELDQALAKGSEQEPEVLTVKGVQIRQGLHISVTARARIVDRGLAILSDLREVLMLDRSVETQGLPFFGWTCESVGESQPIYVDVFQESREGGYSMRVQTMTLGESMPRLITSLQGVSVEQDSGLIRFEGSDQRIAAELRIDAEGGMLNRRDSMLKLTTRTQGLDAENPVEAAVKLVCGRTR